MQITISKDGPYRIAPEQAGDLTIVDHEGTVITPTIGKKGIALCRCGASSKKPFCDGTHSRIGFQAAEAAREAFDERAPGGLGA